MPSNDPKPTKAQRQADARARAAEIRKQQQAAARRNRLLAIGGLALAAVVLIGAFTWVFVSNAQNKAQYGSVAYGGGADGVVAPALADTQAPSTADDGAGIPVSDEGVGVAGDGDTVLSVYFDLQCPACRSFDTVNAADLKALAAEPGITVRYQPLTFLDGYSQGTFFSSRAGNALMVVADQDPDHFQGFITAMYENQPAENTSGLTDDKIAEIASGIGVPQDVIDRFTTTVDGSYQQVDSDGNTIDKTGSWRTFAPFLAAATTHAQDVLGQISTPTLLLDGDLISGQDSSGKTVSKVQWNQPGALAAYVRAAAAAK